MSEVPESGSSTTVESIELLTIRSSQTSLPRSETHDTRVPSPNPQSDTEEVQSAVSYQHYWYSQSHYRSFPERRDPVEYCDCVTDIDMEVFKLKDDGWKDLKSFLDPVGSQRVTLVHLAAFEGEIDILERAVELYANESTVFTNGTNGESTDPWLATDRFGRCALHYVAFEGHGDVIRWLLDKWRSDHSTPHPQISLEDTWGRTPINDAIGRLRPDVVSLLLENGAAVNVRDEHGIPRFLPLKEDAICVYRPFLSSTWALEADKIAERYLHVVYALLKEGTGVDINAGWTMLHHAISLNSEESVDCLIRNGADLNLILPINHKRKLCSPHLSMSTYDYASGIQYEEGLSAFQYAAANGKLEFVRILLKNGGNLAKLYPDSNHTVIDELRFRSDDQDIVNLLTSYFDSQILIFTGEVLFIGLFIIAGFSLSFFILFHNNDQFDNPLKAFSKTIVMMTGEYEYGDLFSATATNNSTNHNLDSQGKKYDELPFVTGRIVLVIFVIITGIVFMNLMIGLAVSDVQALVYEISNGEVVVRQSVTLALLPHNHYSKVYHAVNAAIKQPNPTNDKVDVLTSYASGVNSS